MEGSNRGNHCIRRAPGILQLSPLRHRIRWGVWRMALGRVRWLRSPQIVSMAIDDWSILPGSWRMHRLPVTTRESVTTLAPFISSQLRLRHPLPDILHLPPLLITLPPLSITLITTSTFHHYFIARDSICVSTFLNLLVPAYLSSIDSPELVSSFRHEDFSRSLRGRCRPGCLSLHRDHPRQLGSHPQLH